MGLLDFYAADDEFAFADFDASFSASKRDSTNKDKDNYSSTTSQTSSQSSSSPLDATNSPTASAATSTDPKPSKRPTKHTRRKSTFSKPPKPAAGKCFDLFGEDEELQTAEPKIKFCDICFKHCDVH